MENAVRTWRLCRNAAFRLQDLNPEQLEEFRGSTGDPPVPSGDPPDGSRSGIERKGAEGFSAIRAFPPGKSLVRV
jgi:hypothetical protein